MKEVFLVVTTCAVFSAMLICLRRVFEFQRERKFKKMRNRYFSPPPPQIDILDELKRDCPNIDFEHQIEIEKL